MGIRELWYAILVLKRVKMGCQHAADGVHSSLTRQTQKIRIKHKKGCVRFSRTPHLEKNSRGGAEDAESEFLIKKYADFCEIWVEAIGSLSLGCPDELLS